jgi:general nucleoside transport system permease protein
VNWEAVIGPAAILPLLAAGIRLAMPIVLAAVGESFCQRSGVINLGLEGIMLAGALSAFGAEYATGSPIVGALAGIGAGLVFGVLVGLLVIEARIDQIIVGISIVLLAAGITSFAYLDVFGVTSSPPRIGGSSPWPVPVLSDLPGIGVVLFRQSPLVYAAMGLSLGVWWLLERTRVGLSVRAVGDRPDAAEAVGVSPRRTRWIGVLVSSAMTGFAGAVLVGQLRLFQDGVTAGRGWVAVAIVVLARWNPLGAIAGGLAFGLVDALQLRVQAASGGVDATVPYELFQALPYLMTLTVVVLAAVRFRRDAEPAALGTPYVAQR